jgi:hypothetical protein
MADQLDLAEAPAAAPRAPSAWKWARAKWPGRIIIRIIDLLEEQQEFAVLEFEAGFLVDGATHFLNTPSGLGPNEEDAIVAEYDRRWQSEGRGLR